MLAAFPWPDLWAARAAWEGLLPALRETAGEPPGAEPWRGAVLARGAALARAVRDGDRAGAEDAAAALGGAGEGSTPAGDDLLMGALHALWAADAPARPWSAALARAAAGRTTTASAAWLRDAAAGRVGERWGELLAALAAADPRAARAAASRVRALGHTSGAFSLHGFLSLLRAPL